MRFTKQNWKFDSLPLSIKKKTYTSTSTSTSIIFKTPQNNEVPKIQSLDTPPPTLNPSNLQGPDALGYNLSFWTHGGYMWWVHPRKLTTGGTQNDGPWKW